MTGWKKYLNNFQEQIESEIIQYNGYELWQQT